MNEPWFATEAPEQAPPPRPLPPASIIETFDASRVLARGDRLDAESERLRKAYEPVLAAINADRARRGQAPLRNPGGWWGGDPYAGGITADYSEDRGPFAFSQLLERRVSRAEQQQRIFAELRAIRARRPGFLKDLPDDADTFGRQIIDREQQAREAARGTLSRSEGVAGTLTGFAGGVIETIQDPINIATLPLGGGGTGKTLLQQAARSALINGAIEAAQQPIVAQNRKALGEELTLGEAAENTLGAALGGAIIDVGVPQAAKLAGKIGGAAIDRVAPGFREGLALRFAKLPEASDREVMDAFTRAVPPEARGFDTQAALHMLQRDAEVAGATPFVPNPAGDARHVELLDAAMKALTEADAAERPRTGFAVPPAAPEVTRPAAGVLDMGRYREALRGAESGGSDTAAAATSSAYGRYQFTRSTWLRYYERRFGRQGLSDAQILAKRADGALQDQLLGDLTADNAAVLARNGIQATADNLYALHFAGPADGVKLLQAAPDTPVRGLLRQSSLDANPWAADLTAGQLRARLAQKVGAAPGAEGALSLAPNVNEAIPRPVALDTVRPVIDGQGRAIPVQLFDPRDIGVDADLMQFKSGGDARGVTERLRGVQQWDPLAAGIVTVWEGLDGRRLIADGHQRLGLASRLLAQDTGQEIQLLARVLRESDGFSARDARVMTALKNIGEGSGKAIDAAKLFREADEETVRAWLRRLPVSGGLVKQARGLARLSDDAFGAVVNELVPENHAAAVGELAPDPSTHAGLIELIRQTEPANDREARTVIIQALDAGFSRERQDDLFGGRDAVSSLFIQRARLLDRAMKELRGLKDLFRTAADNADTLEQTGSQIAREASAAEAARNAQALDLIERLALRKGNDVNAAFNAAAAVIAEGRSTADAVRQFVRDIRLIDFDAIGRADRGTGAAGRAGDAAGSADGAGDAAGPLAPEPIDTADGALTPSDFDDAVAAGQVDLFGAGATEATKAFDDPAGAAARVQGDSLIHDLKADVDPAIARRQAEEAALAAQSPLQAKTDQESTIGTPLFDATDQFGFRLEENGPDVKPADLLGEIERDEAAIKSIRGCL